MHGKHKEGITALRSAYQRNSVLAISSIKKLIGRMTLSLQDSNIYYILMKLCKTPFPTCNRTNSVPRKPKIEHSGFNSLKRREDGMVHNLTYHPLIGECDHDVSCLTYSILSRKIFLYLNTPYIQQVTKLPGKTC